MTPPLPFDEVIARAETEVDDEEELGSLDGSSPNADDELTRSELLETSGLSDAQLDALEDHGLLAPALGAGERALYGEEALEVASLAASFHARGIEARHLKMYKHFAEREAALFAQVLLSYQRQRTPDARARLVEALEELVRSGRRLRAAMLHQALREELAE
jgi:DNA-binding transcriptional MerR regulator